MQRLGHLVVVTSLTLVAVFTSYAERRSPLRVAANLPMSGPLSTYGSAVQEGVAFAIQNRSEAGLPTTSITWDWQDNRGDARTTAQTATFQLRRAPDIYVSGVRPQLMAIAKRIEATGLPHFAWVFDSNVRKIAAHTYRTWVSFGGEAELFVRSIVRRAPKRLAVIYVQLPNTEEQYQEIILPKLRESLDIEILVEPFPYDQLDFKALALKVREFNPDLIVVNGFQENLVTLVKSLRFQRLIKEGNTIATFDMFDAARELPAADIEGIQITTPAFMFEQRAEDWKAAFVARYGKEPLYSHYYAYDMANFLFELAGKAEDSDTAAELESRIRQLQWNGITGPIRFDDAGDIPHHYELGVFRNGEVRKLD